MRKLMLAALAAATAISAPAAAQSYRDADSEYNQDVRQANRDYRDRLADADDRGDVRDARRDYRDDVRDARQDYRGNRRDAARNWRSYNRYDYNRPEPGYRGYYADRYYRDGANYRPRALSRNDRVYRGRDGRFYCRRNDGTTGLIAGGAIGGLLGNVIAPGGSKTLGTLLGAAGGAAIGTSVDRNQVTCR